MLLPPEDALQEDRKESKEHRDQEIATHSTILHLGLLPIELCENSLTCDFCHQGLITAVPMPGLCPPHTPHHQEQQTVTTCDNDRLRVLA